MKWGYIKIFCLFHNFIPNLVYFNHINQRKATMPFGRSGVTVSERSWEEFNEEKDNKGDVDCCRCQGIESSTGENAQKKTKEIIIIRMGHTVASGEFNSKLLRPSCHV